MQVDAAGQHAAGRGDLDVEAPVLGGEDVLPGGAFVLAAPDSAVHLAGAGEQTLGVSRVDDQTVVQAQAAGLGAFALDGRMVDMPVVRMAEQVVRKAQAAFERLVELKPLRLVPGHGRVTDLAQARRDTGDYYRFLIDQVGSAARNMDSIGETLDKFEKPKEFMHLENFAELHRANMNRVFVDFEANP
jgi:hypothetical protein